MKKDDKNLLYAGAGAGILASLCCVGPVVLVLLGLTGVSTALSIGKYTWLFATISAILLLVAIIVYLKQKNCCNAKGVKQHWKIMLISFVILVILLIVLRYWLAPLIGTIAYR